MTGDCGGGLCASFGVSCAGCLERLDAEVPKRMATVVCTSCHAGWWFEVDMEWTAGPCPMCGRALEERGGQVLVEPVAGWDGDLSWCAYYRRGEPGQDPHGICSFGCVDEPACVTGQPSEGWPREQRRRRWLELHPEATR